MPVRRAGVSTGTVPRHAIRRSDRQPRRREPEWGSDDGDGPTAEPTRRRWFIGRGIEALSTLVSTLPENFPAPIVIAQHLDPSRVSHLGQILAAKSTNPVQVVADREPLRAGLVYVIPANQDVEITDHEVRLHQEREARMRPSIDLLLASAAEVFGEGLIAVIFTGTGSDGAAGARAVKANGGTVVIQNPETASFPGMPLSLSPTTVDVIANLESVGPLLYDLLTGAYVPDRPDQDQQLRSFLDQLRDRSGIDFTAYKTPTIMRRLRHRMVATGAENLVAYIRYLQRHPDEYQRLINAFLIKVTEFFRDADLFDYLRERVMPVLLADATRRSELQIWSAGCATGEEAYTLAILVSELLEEEQNQVSVRIFATDLDADAVAFARRGTYPAQSLGAVPPDLLDRYFNRLDGAYEVNKRVRSLVVFGQHDLGQRAPFPRIDLALCRNVLIYFTSDLQKRALQLCAFSLRVGGYLVLGKAETVSPLVDSFALEHPRLKIYRRVGERVLIPPARIRDSVPTPLPRVGAPRSPFSGLDVAISRMQREAQRSRSVGDRVDGLLLRLPVGVVLVDRQYDIHFINSVARRHLGIHTSAIGEDLIHLVQGAASAALRVGIDAAFRGQSSIRVVEAAANDPTSTEPRFLELACHNERSEGDADRVDTAILLVDDVTESVRQRREAEQALARQAEESARYAVQIERLTESNRQLLEANQEMTTANAELRSANEELLVANEEVQAATEEVETLNEELHATNEELETLNEELQAAVEELNTTNDDLQARSIEQQDLAINLEAQRRESDTERARLRAVLVGIGDAVLVVGQQGETLLTNRAYAEAFGSADARFVALGEDGKPFPPGETPQERAGRGESFAVEFAVGGGARELRRFEATGSPVDAQEAESSGVLVIRDISERRR
jgi:two-component system CheB/CheR fusion protein